MIWTVYLTGSADRDLGGLDRDVRDRIVAGIRQFAETGHGDVRKLKGAEGLRRLRVGDWRVIYRVPEEDVIEIEAIVHRSKAYRAREQMEEYGVGVSASTGVIHRGRSDSTRPSLALSSSST